MDESVFLKKGFTLTEFLVVMAILGILAAISLANFRTSQMKARDGERKNDLHNIASALEAYMNDHGAFPRADNGRIAACGCREQICTWGSPPREFCDTGNTVYMEEIPNDVLDDPENQNDGPAYCYQTSLDMQKFQLYAKLESGDDPEKSGPYSCGGYQDYNLGVSSQNTKPSLTL